MVRGAVAAAALVLVGFGGTADAKMSDAQVRAAIIKASIDNYSGNCPCPYNSARNGSRCGGRSAWSRAGGEAPKCFPDDVSAADVRAYRSR